MTKIYTKTGDTGLTSLGTGERISKASLHVEAYGTIDELQALLGACRAFAKHEDCKEYIYKIEKDLWLLMADVSSLGKEPMITEDYISQLEDIVDHYALKLEPLNKFIVPGGNKSSAFLHQARTLVRRAERALWRLKESGVAVHDVNVKYLNRLSDCCYILARVEEEL
ncbi:cob(I)yrinic acid a,c-diamide adenosyltransferase [uncultured Veillonella sp.]|uniref:cob(I)yrinic acid a,c-diamide adenosyltransferase n=1 Tax=uncultured Veillonella sp. TaxID=159268 RepID=UPI0025D808C4|nr:cob(I)yrinic acid a,c-diamide adenosyltransferase [uncultured Veillonella sp.]MDY3974590.1 cob(I)yrinic acid a,c-diamide adenosyltransferase [Veillonella caviae]